MNGIHGLLAIWLFIFFLRDGGRVELDMDWGLCD